MGLILVALASLATLSVKNANQARSEAQAARLGQELIEWLRNERDQNWNTFISNATSSQQRCMPVTSWTQSFAGPCNSDNLISNTFKREVVFFPVQDTNSDGLADTLVITISVSWSDKQGVHETKNITRFTHWKL
jgi:type II secretory pathway pseudopilin PulG